MFNNALKPVLLQQLIATTTTTAGTSIISSSITSPFLPSEKLSPSVSLFSSLTKSAFTTTTCVSSSRRRRRSQNSSCCYNRYCHYYYCCCCCCCCRSCCNSSTRKSKQSQRSAVISSNIHTSWKINSISATMTKMSSNDANTKNMNNNNNNHNNNDNDDDESYNDNAVKRAKQNLRQKIRSKLKLLTSQQIKAQSYKVWQYLYNLPQYQSASSVGLFLSMPHGEIDTEEPCIQVLKDGKDLYVPRVGLDFEQCDMEFIKVNNSNHTNHDNHDNRTYELFYKHWPTNKWNIPEPPRDVHYTIAKPGSIDLLIVPGLGFDHHGRRLGQGKGYYDRFITKMNQHGSSTRLFLVGVGLEPSFVPDHHHGDHHGECHGIPTNNHDCIMDAVILPQTGVLLIPPWYDTKK